ncbi:hypothetical protein D3C75_866210 [compost metagenome]
MLFVGNIDSFEDLVHKYKAIKDQSIYMGYQKDLMAVYSICDLYLNLHRIGGGTSAALALLAGIPVFSFPYGDVSNVTTSEYHIHNISDIEEYILKLEDVDFKKLERERILQRADEIFDSSKILCEIIRNAKKQPFFY